MFNEETTAEQIVLDTHCCGATLNMTVEELTPFSDKPPAWRFVSADTLICSGIANTQREAAV